MSQARALAGLSCSGWPLRGVRLAPGSVAQLPPLSPWEGRGHGGWRGRRTVPIPGPGSPAASLHVGLPSGGRCPRPSGLHALSCPPALTDAPSTSPAPPRPASVSRSPFQSLLAPPHALSPAGRLGRPGPGPSGTPPAASWDPLGPRRPARPSGRPAAGGAGAAVDLVRGRGAAGPLRAGPGRAPPAARRAGGQAGTRSRPAAQPRAGSPGMGYFWNVGPAKPGMRRGQPPTPCRTAQGAGRGDPVLCRGPGRPGGQRRPLPLNLQTLGSCRNCPHPGFWFLGLPGRAAQGAVGGGPGTVRCTSPGPVPAPPSG